MARSFAVVGLVLALVVACCVWLEPIQAARMVRVALRKDTLMQGGHLGQPVTLYRIQADFGTPAKRFQMLLDVNAREVWLPHHLRMGMIYSRLNYKKGYSKADSSTSLKEPKDIYKIEYHGCELSGKAYRDLISLPDAIESPNSVTFEQRFLAMSSASNDKFSKYHSTLDGVFAFSPWPISETGSDLICVALKRANLTDSLRIGLALNDDYNGDDGGELALGGLNTLKFKGELRYHHLLSEHEWAVGLQKVMLGANPIDACPNAGNRVPCRALITTTSNEIIGPEVAIKSMLKLLGFEEAEHNFKFSSLYEIDCLKVATAPTLNLVIDGAFYTIPPTSYIKKKVDGMIFKSTTCYVALLPSLSEDSWQLGTNFLSNYYTVFDMEKRAVAFGERR